MLNFLSFSPVPLGCLSLLISAPVTYCCCCSPGDVRHNLSGFFSSSEQHLLAHPDSRYCLSWFLTAFAVAFFGSSVRKQKKTLPWVQCFTLTPASVAKGILQWLSELFSALQLPVWPTQSHVSVRQAWAKGNTCPYRAGCSPEILRGQ